MSNPLVTVFGGSGFLGRHVVRALAKAGWRIRVAVRRPNSAYFLTTMGHVGQIQLMRCNVRDAGQVAAALTGADAAINLVGLLYQKGGQSFTGVHIEAAECVAKGAADAHIKTLVHVSAIGADAESKCRYNATKGEGEAAVRRAFPDATILRPSLLFGPEDSFFNKFAWLARLAPALPLIGGGRTKFQPVFVGDVAAAVQRAAEDAATRGKTYELGGPTVYTFKELMQEMLREIGRRRLLVPIPFLLASVKAFFLQMSKFIGVPPLLTPDQVEMLKTNNVVGNNTEGLSALGVAPVALEAVIPSYLWRFRPKGQFQEAPTSRAPAPQ